MLCFVMFIILFDKDVLMKILVFVMNNIVLKDVVFVLIVELRKFIVLLFILIIKLNMVSMNRKIIIYR